jgi:exosome complex component MTR3
MALNFDRRRINGPEESFPPEVVDEEAGSDAYAGWKLGQARHGRAALDIRPICKLFVP